MPADPTLLPLDQLLTAYRPGSQDPPWTWQDEYDDLMGSPAHRQIMADLIGDLRAGRPIHTPVEVHDGERRVWDGLDAVPVTYARYSDTGRAAEETHDA